MKTLLKKPALFPLQTAAIGLVLLLLPHLLSNPYQLRVWMLLLIYAVIALGLNILVGLAGLVSLGQAGLFAIGSYTVAIVTTKFGLGLVPSLVLAMVIAGVFGAILSYPTVRVRGVYLAVVTIAFGIIIENVAIEWTAVTGGTMGISNIPKAGFGGVELDDTKYFYLLVVLFLAAFVLQYNIMSSRFGRAMRAVNQSETALRAIGVNPIAVRTLAFVIAAVFAGLAGGLYTYLNLYVNPDTFRFDDSVRFLLMVILGGAGTTVGPVLGATILTFLPEYFQALGVWQRFGYGALLALVMFAMPLGIVGTARLWLSRRKKKVCLSSSPWPHRTPDIDAMLQVKQNKNGICLKTSALTMAFGGLRANSDVDATVKTGHIHAVIGPNGAGKSTFMNCISGFYSPTSGRVEFAGVDTTGKPSHHLARLGLARTFQNTELFGDMTVLENVLVGFHTKFRSGLFSTLLRLPLYFREEEQYRNEAMRLLEYVGLKEYAEELACNLPFGHQRRLEIARALALSPKLLLLDEPAAGLTHAEIEDLSALIKDLAKSNVTMILIEHHVDMVMAISDHVTVLDYGEVIASGTVDSVQNNPKVIEAYFGTEADTSSTTVIKGAA